MIIEKKEEKCQVEVSNLLTPFRLRLTEFMCMPCVKYAHTNNVPHKLRKYAVGNYGFFKTKT